MRTNCLNFLHVFILAASCLTLDVKSESTDCEAEIKVHRHTAHQAFLGENLRINCTVAFCNKVRPTVTWFKFEKNNTAVPVNVSSGGHITTEWKLLSDHEGISFLNINRILRNDSGNYQCRSEGSVSHSINVFFQSEVRLTTATWTTQQLGSPDIPDTFWLFVYQVVGIFGFVILVLSLFVAARCRCKGESSDKPDPGLQRSHDASSPVHIYDNVL